MIETLELDFTEKQISGLIFFKITRKCFKIIFNLFVQNKHKKGVIFFLIILFFFFFFIEVLSISEVLTFIN